MKQYAVRTYLCSLAARRNCASTSSTGFASTNTGRRSSVQDIKGSGTRQHTARRRGEAGRGDPPPRAHPDAARTPPTASRQKPEATREKKIGQPSPSG